MYDQAVRGSSSNALEARSLSRRNMMHGKKFIAGGESVESDDGRTRKRRRERAHSCKPV